tara:strand:- start:85 stop:255 length:171 start_codon:yes stop_codon:yes gene_type:complete
MKKKESIVVLVIFLIVLIATFVLETHNDNESKRISKQVKELSEAKEAKRNQDSLKF